MAMMMATASFEEQLSPAGQEPIKISGGFCKQRSMESDASTAASSIMHSPLGGPGELTPDASWAFGELGAALAILEAPTDPVGTLEQAQRQIEWIFSAESLKHNKLLKAKMDCFGWVRLVDVLNLYSMRQVKVSELEAVTASKTSRIIQLSGDSRRIRSRDPEQWLGARLWERQAPIEVPSLAPEVEVADEDVTIAAHITDLAQEVVTQPLSALWLSSEPNTTLCLDALLFEEDFMEGKASKGKGARKNKKNEKDAYESEETPTMAAWMRTSDDGYFTAAASLLQW